MVTRLRQLDVDGPGDTPPAMAGRDLGSTRATHSGRMSWGTKMFLTQAMVLAASIATAGLVASIIGPRLFHGHLLQIAQELGSEEFAHIERAFIDAGVVSLAAGLLVALTGALVASWYDTRRLRRPLDQLTSAASKVSAGDFAASVPATGFSSELDAVGNAFNGMAHRLAATEETRRRLLADVSHEVRTPIATLTALLEAVADDITPWNEETLNLLMLQTERLQRIARDLDAVSRAEEGQLSLLLEAVDMRELMDRAAATARGRYMAKGVALEQYADQLAVVVDSQRVGQVLGNLLDNALRHTPPGGTVRVVGAQRGNTTVVTVTDTGDGLTADQLDQVFDRFYRADAARARDAAGAGIGLTISRSFAIAHGGSITAASAGPGQGSSFTLTLPCIA